MSSAVIVSAPFLQTPRSAGTPDPTLVDDLITANRILAQEGIVDGFGHVSARHDKDPTRYLLSRSLAPGLVTAADLIEYDLDSNPVNANNRALYSERFIHGEIYKARAEVKAIVHNHSAAVVPYSVSAVPLRPVYHMAAFIGEGLTVFDIRDAAGVSDMLVSNAERGGALARSLGNKPAILMRGHGIAVVGPSLQFAVGRSIYIEMNARIQSQAISLGGGVTYLDPDEAREAVKAGENGGYARPWELWKQKTRE